MTAEPLDFQDLLRGLGALHRRARLGLPPGARGRRLMVAVERFLGQFPSEVAPRCAAAPHPTRCPGCGATAAEIASEVLLMGLHDCEDGPFLAELA